MDEDNDSKRIDIPKEEKVDDGMNKLSIYQIPTIEEIQKMMERNEKRLEELSNRIKNY